MEIDPINSVGKTGSVNRAQPVTDPLTQATLEDASQINDYLHLSKAARDKAKATETPQTESTSSLYEYLYNVIQVQFSKSAPVNKVLKSIKNFFQKTTQFFSKDKRNPSLSNQDQTPSAETTEEGLVITLTDEHLSMLKRNEILKAEKGKIYESFHRNDSDSLKGTLVNYKI